MDSLIPGRYYKFNNGVVSAYYICSVPGHQQRAILGLKPPSEILEWLQGGIYRSVYATPSDLMAIRDSTLVTTGDERDTNDVEFEQMRTLLKDRNDRNYAQRQKEASQDAALEKQRRASQDAALEKQRRAERDAQRIAKRDAQRIAERNALARPEDDTEEKDFGDDTQRGEEERKENSNKPTSRFTAPNQCLYKICLTSSTDPLSLY
jgi:type IV secretory pathway VirB10-like protein